MTYETGDLVKIRKNGERFWVKIAEMPEVGQCKGILQNNLVQDGRRVGDSIWFNKDEIVACQAGHGDQT